MIDIMKVYTKKVECERLRQVKMEQIMNQLKVCRKCKQIKPMSTFGTDKTNKSGLQSWCRACKAGWARQHYATSSRQTDKQVLITTLENWLEWYANHFGDFSDEINNQLFCLGHDTEIAIKQVL